MSFSGFPADTVPFLAALAAHNDRDWFQANRGRYEPLLDASKAFVDALGPRLRDLDPALAFSPRVNGSLFRINRDTRFSKDKRPYKTELGFRFWRGDSPKDGGSALMMRIAPGFMGFGAGTWAMEPPTLARYQAAVAGDAGERLAAVLAGFEQTSPTEAMAGTSAMHACHYTADAFKRVPKPYPADHPRAGLLKLKGLFVGVNLPVPDSLGSAAFVDDCVRAFEGIVPVHLWLVEHVTG